jgi:hypothetical protein
LIVICQTCHDKVHNGELHIGEVKITSDGPERIVSTSESALLSVIGAPLGALSAPLEPGLPSHKLKKAKWQDEELETIMNTLRTYSSLSLKSIKAHLNSKHDIDISESMLGKMRRDL